MNGAPDALPRALAAEAAALGGGGSAEAARCAAVVALLHARLGQAGAARRRSSGRWGPRAQGAAGELAVCRLWVAEAWWDPRRPEGRDLEARQVVQYADEFERPTLRSWADRFWSGAGGPGTSGRRPRCSIG